MWTRAWLSAFVIGSPGVVGPKTGDLSHAINLPDWHEGVLGALRGALKRPVIIENDVNLAALAERSVGAARGLEDFVLVWIGGRLGMAAFLGGKVHRAAAGAAGEIGYLPVPGAPLQEDCPAPGRRRPAVAVGASVVRTLAGVFGFGAPTAGEAVRAAVRAAGQRRAGPNGSASRNGSEASRVSGPSARAHEFLGEPGRRVAIGVASVSVVLDPGLVVLGGDVGLTGGAALADRVAAEVARICPASPASCPPPSPPRRCCAAPCSPPSARPAPTSSTSFDRPSPVCVLCVPGSGSPRRGAGQGLAACAEHGGW